MEVSAGDWDERMGAAASAGAARPLQLPLPRRCPAGRRARDTISDATTPPEPKGPPAEPSQRTMYSVGATHSTVPWLSSGRSSASRRRPLPSRVLKYSTGASFSMVHTLHLNRRPPSAHCMKGFM